MDIEDVKDLQAFVLQTIQFYEQGHFDEEKSVENVKTYLSHNGWSHHEAN